MDARDRDEASNQVTDEQKPNQDQAYDDAWAEIDKAEGQPESDGGNDGFSDTTDPADDAPDDKGKVTPTDSDSLKDDKGKAEDVDKRIKDLQAGFTRVTQENAELKRTLEAFKNGNATAQDVKDQQKKADDARAAIDDTALETVFNEYPELKPVISPLLDTIKELKAETDAIRQDRARGEANRQEEAKKAALDHFEKNILPKVTEGEGGHPDFKEIIANDDYWKWAAEQRPSLRTAALDSADPEDIKWALTEYKKARAIPEARNLKQQDEKRKQDKLTNAMSLRGGSTPFPTGSGKADPNDYDAAWDEADAAERKQNR